MRVNHLIVPPVLLALLATACSTPSASPSGTPSGTPQPGTTAPGTTRPSTAGTSAGGQDAALGTPGRSPSTPADSGPAPAPRWVRVLRQPVDGQHLLAQQRRYLVTRASDDAGTTTITERTTRRVAVRHVPPDGFVAQSPVVIDDRWALIEEIRSDGPNPQIRAYRYDLRTGARQDLAEVEGLPRITEPEIGAYDGTFAFTTTDARRRSCLMVGELATLKARRVSCVAAPGYVADPVVSADSVTFSEITAPETPKRCKRVLTAALDAGPARPVAAVKPCIQWSAAALDGATIWSEVAASDPDQYQSKAYLRESADGPVKSLGTILTDTIVPCGSWIHWEVRTVVNGAEQYKVLRWRVGLAQPQPIYSSLPDTALSGLSCQDSKLLVESAHLGAGTKHADALLADAG
jgi:hypothetical protein